MTLTLDTFLTALYTITDDLYLEHAAAHKPARPGKAPQFSDSEVLTLIICAQWYHGSERAFLRHVLANWRSYFPRLLSQSAFNRRSRDLAGVLTPLVGVIATQLEAYLAPYQVLDTLPVPLMRRCRGQRHRLFADEAAIGKGGSDHDWYYGCKLLVALTNEGVITGFTLAPASTEDRWAGEALLCWRVNQLATPATPEELPPSHRKGGGYVGPTGPLWPRSGVGELSPVSYLGDNGFFGRWWQEHWLKEYQATVFTPKNYQGEEALKLKKQHSRWRQVVERVNESLTHVFGLSLPLARSKWGLLTRVAANLVALNLGIWLNRLFGRADLALATPFSF